LFDRDPKGGATQNEVEVLNPAGPNTPFFGDMPPIGDFY
jgi:hypothetical protein